MELCTIAYGHLVRRAPCDGTEPPDFRRGLSKDQGTVLLTEDMAKVRQVVTSLVQVEMNDGQYGALSDFVYNVGSTNFSKSTLLRAVNSKHIDRVPTQFRRWILANGKELEALKVRREREIALFFDGQQIPNPREEESAPPIDIRKGEEYSARILISASCIAKPVIALVLSVFLAFSLS